MPFFVKRFGREAEDYGIMLSALGLGALAGTFTVGKVRANPRVGYFMIGGTITFTAAVISFAFAPSFYVAIGLLFIGGLDNEMSCTVSG